MNRNMIEQVKDAKTPEEMRAEIFRLQRYDPLVRAVIDSSQYRGASAEDTYTVLAYNAMKQLAEIKQHVFDDAIMRPPQPVFVMPNVQIEGQAASGLSRSNAGLCVNTTERGNE